jgi:uncharacterized membrane protein
MKDEMAILIASSIYIKAFAVCLSLALCTLIFIFFGGGAPWWTAFGVFMFLSNLAVLLEFIDDRRIYDTPEDDKKPWMLRRQSD